MPAEGALGILLRTGKEGALKPVPTVAPRSAGGTRSRCCDGSEAATDGSNLGTAVPAAAAKGEELICGCCCRFEGDSTSS